MAGNIYGARTYNFHFDVNSITNLLLENFSETYYYSCFSDYDDIQTNNI